MNKLLLALAVFISFIGSTTGAFGQTDARNLPKGFTASETPTPSLPKMGYETPQQLSEALIEAIRDNDLDKFKTCIPHPEQLRMWFDTLLDENPQSATQKEWMLNRSKTLHSGEAEEILKKVRLSGSDSNVTFSPVGSATVKISQKYFYDEADVLVSLPNGWVLKIKDCVKTPSGWCFLSEMKLKK